MACGACHDNISFTTGANHPAPAGQQIQLDDTQCGTCHSSASIQLNHLPITGPDLTNGGLTAAQGGQASNTHTNSMFVASNPSPSTLPTGALAITWNLVSAAVDASGHPSWTFQPFLNGTATTIPAYNGTSVFEMFPNMVGTPTLEMVFAVPQDGIAAPADFNSSVSVSMKSVWRGSKASTYNGTTWTTGAALAGSSWTANTDGTYTAYYAGATVPSNATILTGGIGYNYGVVAATTVAGLATATPVQAGSVTDSLPLTQTNLTGTYAFTANLPGRPRRSGTQRQAAGERQPSPGASSSTTPSASAATSTWASSPTPPWPRLSTPVSETTRTQCVFCHNANGFDNADGSYGATTPRRSSTASTPPSNAHRTVHLAGRRHHVENRLPRHPEQLRSLPRAGLL